MHQSKEIFLYLMRNSFAISGRICKYSVAENNRESLVFFSLKQHEIFYIKWCFLFYQQMCTLFQKMLFRVCFLKMFRPLKVRYVLF